MYQNPKMQYSNNRLLVKTYKYTRFYFRRLVKHQGEIRFPAPEFWLPPSHSSKL